MARVSLVSLGCPKNLVDSECALGELVRAGHELVVDNSLADVIVVNTCGFIESARAESVEAILEALEHKDIGGCKAVVVAGCLSQRYAPELAKEMPGVDVFLGIDGAGKLADAIDRALAGERIIDASRPGRKWESSSVRVQSTPPWTAYLKVSDGCDNRCAYCAIPDIRGRFRSRPEDSIIDEAKSMAESGVKEIVLVGQDLTQYGADFDRASSKASEVGRKNHSGKHHGLSIDKSGQPPLGALAKLLVRLNEIDSLRWIRLMYCYPTKVTWDLIEAVASCDKVVKYMDIPLQHGDDRMLAAMSRGGSAREYIRLVDSLRRRVPGIALRSSFIVGFPGETEAAFENLCDFIERIAFDRVGVFAYSREEGTPAARMKGRVRNRTAAARYDRVMRLQQAISLRRNASLIGKSMEVLVEGTTEDGVFGRSYRDAPEIDGLVYVQGSNAKPGEFVNTKITEAREYDLVGNDIKNGGY